MRFEGKAIICVLMSGFSADALAQSPANPQNRKIVTHYADKATCRDGATQFDVGNDKDGIELFYYEHDPRRLYLRSGFTYLLGSTTSCTFRGLEDYRSPRP